MQYNFSKLDLSQKVEIWLYSKISDGFSKRSALGIQIRTGGSHAFLTERIEYETSYSDILVIEKMFQLLKELVLQPIFQQEITIYTEFNFQEYLEDPTLYEYNYLREKLNWIRVELHHYQVSGFEFNFISCEMNSILKQLVITVLETYFIVNDFLNRREFLSVISGPEFDKDFYNSLLPQGSQIIQYVDQFTNLSINGPEKRILRPLDSAAGDGLIKLVNTIDRFPSTNERKNFLIRRISIALTQANVAILFSTFDDNNYIVAPDFWVYELSKQLKIPFYFYDCNIKAWYTISKDKDQQREFIHIKNFKITQKQIMYYVNSSYMKDALIEWKRVLNKNFI